MGFLDWYIRELGSPDEWQHHVVEEQPGETQLEIAANKAQIQKRQLEETLARKIDRLTLVSNAIWELVRDSSNLSERDLFEKIKEIDLRDGVADGKITRVPKPCPKCGRKISIKTGRCMYCGTSVPLDTPFDAI